MCCRRGILSFFDWHAGMGHEKLFLNTKDGRCFRTEHVKTHGVLSCFWLKHHQNVGFEQFLLFHFVQTRPIRLRGDTKNKTNNKQKTTMFDKMEVLFGVAFILS